MDLFMEDIIFNFKASFFLFFRILFHYWPLMQFLPTNFCTRIFQFRLAWNSDESDPSQPSPAEQAICHRFQKITCFSYVQTFNDKEYEKPQESHTLIVFS